MTLNAADEQTEAVRAALAELRTALGEDAVLTGDAIAEYVDPYEPISWGGQRNAAVVTPTSTEEVAAVVKIANRHEVPIWVGSQGRNNGYGGAGTLVPGSIIVSLRKMDRVLEINEDLGYVVVEPGVSYNSLHAEVRRQGKKVMIDCPDLGWGSLIGNACDHGLGYTKYGDHAQAICGMEVVLPDGEIIRTGMGALEQTETWNIYQNGYGPNPEQIFIQSNFGIITQAGFWVMPEPEYYLNGQISIAEDEDFPGFVDALRPLMVDGTIQNFPSCFGAPAILQLGGKRKDYWQGEGPIPLEIIETVRRKVGAGAWNLRFALYGREGQVDESFAHIRKTLDGVLGVTVTGQKYLTADLPQTELDQSASVQAGIPEMSMLESVKFWSDNGGHVGFSSVLPLAGKDVKATMELVQEACREFGLDYTSTFYIGSRFIVHVFLSFFDRDDDEQTRRVYRMCRETVQKAAALGYGEYRAHLSNMDVVSGVYSFNDDAQRRFNERLKDALDPKGILMPGRSGIWPVKYREQGTPDQPWL